jgi:flagellar motor component MotA
MDSWQKSAVVGRVAGSVSWIIVALLSLIFDVIVDPETTGAITEAATKIITGVCMLWGIWAPINSKIRQQREKENKIPEGVING